MAEQERPHCDEYIEEIENSRRDVSKGDNEEHDRARAMAEAEDPYQEGMIIAKKLGVNYSEMIGGIGSGNLKKQADKAAELAAEKYDRESNETTKEQDAYQRLADQMILHALKNGVCGVKETTKINVGGDQRMINFSKLEEILNDRLYEQTDEEVEQKVPGFGLIKEGDYLGVEYDKPIEKSE